MTLPRSIAFRVKHDLKGQLACRRACSSSVMSLASAFSTSSSFVTCTVSATIDNAGTKHVQTVECGHSTIDENQPATRPPELSELHEVPTQPAFESAKHHHATKQGSSSRANTETKACFKIGGLTWFPLTCSRSRCCWSAS